MTTVYRDDITGKEYKSDTEIHEFSVVTCNMAFKQFDTVDPTDNEHVDDIAEELHSIVDEWAEDRKQYNDERGEIDE